MSNFTHSIKFKIVLAFSVCVALLIANGGFGVFGLSQLSSNMRVLYSNNTVPISQLGNVRFHQASLRFLILQAQHENDPNKAARLASDIRSAQAALDKDWAAYYPDGISNDQERELADQIHQSLVGIASLVAATLSSLDDKNFEQTTVLADALLPEMAASVSMLTQDAELNCAGVLVAIFAVISLAAASPSLYCGLWD